MLASLNISPQYSHLTANLPFIKYSLPVFLTVLGEAVMHAGWNALVRGGNDPRLHTAAIVIWTGVIASPFAIISLVTSKESLIVLFYSVVVHLIYYFALTSAYRLAIQHDAYGSRLSGNALSFAAWVF